MPTKVFFAAVEQAKRHEMFNELGIRYRLVSYYYLRNRNAERLDEMFYNTNPSDVKYIVDSGAFTLMESKREKFQNDPASFWSMMDSYADDYTAFLTKYRSRIFAAAELDMDQIVLMPEVLEYPSRWKTKLNAWVNNGDEYAPPPVMYWLRQLRTSGVPIIPIWHGGRGKEAWGAQCKDADYIGLPSAEGGKEQHWFPLVLEAKNAGAKIHAFGMTVPKWIRKYPLYSCDSSSWLMGERFGQTMIFQNGRLRYFEKGQKEVRKRYRRQLEQWGIDWKKFEADDPETVNKVNLVAWCQFSEYLYKSPNKDYWTHELDGSPVGSAGAPRGENAPGDPIDMTDIDPEVLKEDEEAMERSEELVKRQEAAPLVAVNPFRLLKPTLSLADAASEGMKCNQCFIQDRCEYFQADASCHYKLDNGFSTEADFTAAFSKLAKMQYSRAVMGMMMERADGGVIDKALSQEVQRAGDMLNQLRLNAPEQDTLKIEAKGGNLVASILAGVFNRPAAPVAVPELPEALDAEAEYVED